MEPQKITVRTALMPICYMDFHCLAAACHDNCCGGWEITFNKKDYLRIKHMAKSRELAEILARGMSRFRKNATEGRYAHFCAASEERCALQTEEGLCRLQLECGEEALPKVCQIYPRSEGYTAAGKELALSPSCEGVLAQLWDLPQGIDFWEEPLPEQEWRVIQASPWQVRFADIRSFCVDVLQERTLPLFQRMQLLGVLLWRLKEVDWTREGVVDGWLTQGEGLLRSPAAYSMLEHLPKSQDGFLMTNLRILASLYRGNTGKENVYRTLFSAVSAEADWEEKGLDEFTIDMNRYRALQNRLVELLGHTDYFFENLMVMVAFYTNIPDLRGAEELWRSYVQLCVLYSFYWFAAVCGCAQENSRQRLFQVLGTVSRSLLHNRGRLDLLLDMLLEGGNGTLDNMAVLAGGITASR